MRTLRIAAYPSFAALSLLSLRFVQCTRAWDAGFQFVAVGSDRAQLIQNIVGEHATLRVHCSSLTARYAHCHVISVVQILS